MGMLELCAYSTPNISIMSFTKARGDSYWEAATCT